MSRQLNLRVSDEFAERLERVARSTGRPMSAVLETVGTPALDAAEADVRFEDEAFVAWEAYQMTGERVEGHGIEALFTEAGEKARRAASASHRKK